MGLLNWLPGNTKRTRIERTILIDNYSCIAHLSKQIRNHAEHSPYEFVAERLRQVAIEKEKNLPLLEEAIEKLGGRVATVNVGLSGGRNHWERLAQDLKDQKRLEEKMLGDTRHFAANKSENGNLLRRLATVEKKHRGVINDLLSKADPQAQQT